jgi:hypothetical protein
MAIEPQVFICYGRPDRAVAHLLAAEFWRNRIECYNYTAKPLEDRLGNELHQVSYIYSSRLFIAIISKESVQRFSVAEEIAHAQQMSSLSEDFVRVHVLTDAEPSSFPEPDLIVNWALPNLATIVKELLGRMGPSFVERNQKAWDVNKSLYTDKWKDLDASYSGYSTDVEAK